MKPEKKGSGVMNIILVIVGVSLLVFTVTMIIVFIKCSSVPDTLVTCVFAALAGECGVMGWIKTNKDRLRERRWEEQNRDQTGEMRPQIETNDDIGDCIAD